MSMPPGAGNPDPTVPIPPVGGPESFASGDPTVAVPVATGGPPRSGAPGGGAPGGPQGGGTGDDEAGDNRKWLKRQAKAFDRVLVDCWRGGGHYHYCHHHLAGYWRRFW